MSKIIAERRCGMNTLAHGLLSLLTITPASGYDLMLKLQLLWPANHSQIYPLLAKLEERGYVEYDMIAQSDKPDKKVYAITEAGKAALQKWIAAPTGRGVTKDELTLKTVCISISDPVQGIMMFEERNRVYSDKLDDLGKKLAMIISEYDLDEAKPDYRSPGFGVYVLLKRAVTTTTANREWCEWVIGLIRNAVNDPDTGSGQR
jgi:PadR family transcriptional regulator AphA